jgi:hypothetical protein
MIHAKDLVLTPVNPNPTLVSQKEWGKKHRTEEENSQEKYPRLAEECRFFRKLIA